jgi:hypothetical protein
MNDNVLSCEGYETKISPFALSQFCRVLFVVTDLRKH